MNLNEIIAVNLKRLRAERGFSLGKLSELSGVSNNFIQIHGGTSFLLFFYFTLFFLFPQAKTTLAALRLPPYNCLS